MQEVPTKRRGDEKKRFAYIIPSLCLGLPVTILSAKEAVADDLTLTSSDFGDGDYLANEHVFAGFGCEAHNLPILYRQIC